MAVVLGMSACGGYTVGFMWVLGTQYNRIAGFKIDDYTGNLTTMINSPYSSGGANPVSLTVRTGGNFVFVVNKGTVDSKGNPNGDGNVAVFAVGEDGVLTPQGTYQTAGNSPVWAEGDTTGSYLYVLDSQAPDYATTGNGDVTVFQVDGTTGRLQIVPNQQIKDSQGKQLNYFEVGPAPTMMRSSGSCLYTLDTGDQTIYPYGIGSNGQLTIQVNSRIQTGAQNLTSISAAGSNIYLTDAGTNQILPYTPGNNCNLSAQVAGAVNNLPLTVDPVFTLTDSSGQFLYVLNHGNNTPGSTNSNSTISAFVIQSNGKLVPISDISNPYPVGNGPVCMVEDPSHQYVYTSNSNDGSVTGKYINQKTGQLSNLPRGSNFSATGLATCLAVSGNVD
ncbi:MAG TPA: beta-propeller fold lactonase family protein [Acidobacteriaceae bacterium]|nr:beta-propeller fold lactonase family protein [Acidobacteriaceae bacterium]